jgi:hypothetical protein
MSADGQRIYTAGGATLEVPADVTTTLCSYGGNLPGVTLIQHLSEAPQAQRVVLVPGVVYFAPDTDPNADDRVRVHDTSSFGFVAEYALPPFPLAGGKSATARGRFVFTTPAMDHIYAIVTADPARVAQPEFAIVTLVP